MSPIAEFMLETSIMTSPDNRVLQTRTWGRTLNRIASRVRWAGTAWLTLGSVPSLNVMLGPRSIVRVSSGGKLLVQGNTVFQSDISVTVRGSLHIGSDVFCGRWTNVVCYDNVKIGNKVRIAERVSIHDESHLVSIDSSDRVDEYTTKRIVIEDGVWLGAGTVVLPGAHVGRASIIGANSVVRGHIPPGVVAAGVPARVISELPLRGDSK